MPRLFPCREVLHPSQDEPSFSSRIANQKHILSCWYLATLKVRTLLEEQGRIGSSYVQLIVKLNVVASITSLVTYQKDSCMHAH